MQVDEYELKDDLKYDKNKNWIRIQGDVAIFGINDVGVKLAKDIAFIELPENNSNVEMGKPCGQIESAKWAGEVIAPVSGQVIEVNLSVSDDPSGMNKDPYGAWIAKIKMNNPDEAKGLMDASSCAEWVKSGMN